jgi:hypothetical protein
MANLSGANLRGTNVLVLYGLGYGVIINNDEIRIGCKNYATAEWENFTDEEIEKMDGAEATEFWRKHKDIIISLANKVVY